MCCNIVAQYCKQYDHDMFFVVFDSNTMQSDPAGKIWPAPRAAIIAAAALLHAYLRCRPSQMQSCHLSLALRLGCSSSASQAAK